MEQLTEDEQELAWTILNESVGYHASEGHPDVSEKIMSIMKKMGLKDADPIEESEKDEDYEPLYRVNVTIDGVVGGPDDFDLVEEGYTKEVVEEFDDYDDAMELYSAVMDAMWKQKKRDIAEGNKIEYDVALFDSFECQNKEHWNSEQDE